jgi:hypothetical protein
MAETLHNPPATTEQWRTCIGCQQALPPTDFRRYYRRCRKCEYERRKEMDKSRSVRLREELKELIDNLATGKADTITTSLLAHGIIAQYGGATAFMHDWAVLLKEAMAAAVEKRTYKVALDGFYAMAKMIMAADEHRSKNLDVKEMSDEDLEDLIDNLLVERAGREGSDALARLAEARGMRLVPAIPQPEPAVLEGVAVPPLSLAAEVAGDG